MPEMSWKKVWCIIALSGIGVFAVMLMLDSKIEPAVFCGGAVLSVAVTGFIIGWLLTFVRPSDKPPKERPCD